MLVFLCVCELSVDVEVNMQGYICTFWVDLSESVYACVSARLLIILYVSKFILLGVSCNFAIRGWG